MYCSLMNCGGVDGEGYENYARRQCRNDFIACGGMYGEGKIHIDW